MRLTSDSFILAAPHFEETAVVICLSELRKEGLTAVLVSIAPGLLSGLRGITLRPDFSLAQVNEFVIKPRQMVIIAGGAEAASATLTDPRAHQLIQNILAGGGYIAGMWQTCSLIEESGLVTPQNAHRFLRQEGIDTAVFIQQLINVQLQK